MALKLPSTNKRCALFHTFFALWKKWFLWKISQHFSFKFLMNGSQLICLIFCLVIFHAVTLTLIVVFNFFFFFFSLSWNQLSLYLLSSKITSIESDAFESMYDSTKSLTRINSTQFLTFLSRYAQLWNKCNENWISPLLHNRSSWFLFLFLSSILFQYLYYFKPGADAFKMNFVTITPQRLQLAFQ